MVQVDMMTLEQLFYQQNKNTSLVLILILKWSFCVTAFIQSDTIQDFLHFDEGRLLQVRPYFFLFCLLNVYIYSGLKSQIFSMMSHEGKLVCVTGACGCVWVCECVCEFACVVLYTSLCACECGRLWFSCFICLFHY